MADDSKWKDRDNRVLMAEYKLMSLKEKKLLEGLKADEEMISSHRRRLGLTFDELAGSEEGYYSRYVFNRPAKPVQKQASESAARMNIKKMKPALKTLQKTKSTAKLLSSPSKLQPPLTKVGQQGTTWVSKELPSKSREGRAVGGLSPSSARRRVTFTSAAAHPNTNEYVQFILKSSEAYGRHHSDRSINGDSDQDRSMDRRKISLDDSSYKQSEQDVTHHRPHTANSKRDGAPKPRSETNGIARKLGPGRSSNDIRVLGSHSDVLDLAEFVSEEQAIWEEAAQSQAASSQQGNGKYKIAPQPHPQPTRPSKGEGPIQNGHAGRLIAPIKPIHPKQTSFENALKLREGKIFAKFNKELRIYDLRDLDCQVGMEAELLLRHRAAAAERD